MQAATLNKLLAKKGIRFEMSDVAQKNVKFGPVVNKALRPIVSPNLTVSDRLRGKSCSSQKGLQATLILQLRKPSTARLRGTR